MSALEGFNQLLTGKQQAKPTRPTGPHEGVVLDVVGNTAVVHQISVFGRDTRFGPMPFGRTDTPPEVGDRCVVLFLGSGIGKAWLLTWQAP